MVTYMEPDTVPSYMSVNHTRWMLRMPNFTRATHAQPPLSKFSQVGLKFRRADPLTRDDRLEQTFPTSPQNKITKLTHCSIHMSIRTISSPHTK